MTAKFSFHQREIAKNSKRYYSKYCYSEKNAIVLERQNFYVYSIYYCNWYRIYMMNGVWNLCSHCIVQHATIISSESIIQIYTMDLF